MSAKLSTSSFPFARSFPLFSFTPTMPRNRPNCTNTKRLTKAGESIWKSRNKNNNKIILRWINDCCSRILYFVFVFVFSISGGECYHCLSALTQALTVGCSSFRITQTHWIRFAFQIDDFLHFRLLLIQFSALFPLFFLSTRRRRTT